MRNFLFAVLLFVTLVGSATAEDVSSIRDDTVLVTCSVGKARAMGTGVLFKRDQTTYVLTAQHVIKPAEAAKLLKKSFSITVRKQFYKKNGLRDGHLEIEVELMATDHLIDVALLKVSQEGLFKPRTKFHIEASVPQLGTEIWHMGNIYGDHLPFTLLEGVISYLDRKLPFAPVPKDQTSAQIQKGCSGGGVFLKGSQKYIGMIVIVGHDQGFFVPIRQILAWAKKKNLYWLFDLKAKKPAPKVKAKAKAKPKPKFKPRFMFPEEFDRQSLKKQKAKLY